MCDKRRAGRTSRMLREAIKLSEEGRAVYILAAHEAHRKDLQQRLPEELRMCIKVETLNSLGTYDLLSTLAGRMPHAHPNCVLLVHHYVIEEILGPILGMLHRWDQS